MKVHVLTSLPYRHWDEWRTNLRHHIFIAEIESGETHDVTPGDFDSPPHFTKMAALHSRPIAGPWPLFPTATAKTRK